jgi:hypothetical protein
MEWSGKLHKLPSGGLKYKQGDKLKPKSWHDKLLLYMTWGYHSGSCKCCHLVGYSAVLHSILARPIFYPEDGGHSCSETSVHIRTTQIYILKKDSHFVAVERHQVTKFLSLWAITGAALKPQQSLRRRRRETKQNHRTRILLSLLHPSPSTPPALFSLYQVYLWATIFIFACGDKFYLPRDLLVFLSSEISPDAPLPAQLPLLLARVWDAQKIARLSPTPKNHAVKIFRRRASKSSRDPH